MTDGIIFDVDGTLWDSTDVVAIGYNLGLEGFTDYTVRVDGSRLKQLFGKPMDQIFRELLPDAPADECAFLADKCMELEEIEIEKADPAPMLYDGIEEMLRILSASYPLFIVSNCQCGYIEQFLRKTGFGRYITAHLCFGQTKTTKGRTILRLMRENGLTSPVYVGDTRGDQEACREAGIPFVFAEYGFGEVTDPDYRIASPMALTELPL